MEGANQVTHTDEAVQPADGEEQHVRIFLLDDHEVVRRGIAELLSAVPGFEIVGEAGRSSRRSRA